MKLDANCVRDVLLFLEAEQNVITNDFGYVEVVGSFLPEICKHLPQYPQEKLYYTLSKLEDGGYLDLSEQWADDSLRFCCVNYITYDGHEFLEKIRPATVWEKTTKVVGKIGSYSLQLIAKVAEGVATAYINKLISG